VEVVMMTGEAAGTAATVTPTVTPSPGVMKTGGVVGLLEVGTTLHAIEALRAAAMVAAVAADPHPADTPLPAAVALLPGARACCVEDSASSVSFFPSVLSPPFFFVVWHLL